MARDHVSGQGDSGPVGEMATPVSDHLLAQEAHCLRKALGAARTVAWCYDFASDSLRLFGESDGLSLEILPEVIAFDDFSQLFAGADIQPLRNALARARIPGPQSGEITVLLPLADRRIFLFSGRTVSIAQATGTLVELKASVTAAPQSREGRVSGLALMDVHKDPLTGLYNRQGFLKAAQTFLARSGEYDLVAADLNRFRRLNEALGHERADMVLAIVAQRLRDAFPEGAVLSRLGEDEFAVLTQRGFPRISERVRLALERPITVAGFEIHPTFAMGAVSVEGGALALDSAELLRRAEMAVDAAQLKGAGSVASYKRALESDGLSRLALEADLRRAFISGEITAHYQPIIDLQTQVITGFEALARWEHPRRGLVPPDQFLGATRDLGLMCDLGIIMLETSARAIQKWQRLNLLPENFFVTVNLSAPELERIGLVQDVRRLIEEGGFPAGRLKLEVTESDVMNDPQLSARVLQALREAGAGVALDDFGTGFSSLSYLARLPVDTLKIDRSFVSTMMSEASSLKIVRSILTLGHDLGLDVVAEGIEDIELAEQLGRLGCDMGQGWAFSKALRAPEAEAFLTNSLCRGLARSA